MKLRSLNRYQAFAWHFLFSALLGLAVFLLFRFVWYPDALFTLAGAGTLMLLVVGIDVTLGPLLTLIVFNPSKKSLVLDLSVILALQMAALGYGIWVMAQSRPVFLVAAVDRFELIAANEIHPEELKQAKSPHWRQLSWNGPVVTAVALPSNPQERMARTLDAIKGGPDLSRLPRYYIEITDALPALIEKARPLAAYESRHPSDLAAARAWIRGKRISEYRVAVLPIKARRGFGSVLIDLKTGSPLRFMAFDGFDVDHDGKSTGN